MKAQTLEVFNKPYVLRDDVSEPHLVEALDLIIRVEAASFCHTDELLRTGQRAVLPELPFIGCHEFAGIVTAIGPGVQEFKVGDKIGVPSKGFHSCGNCKECMWTDSINDEPGYSVYCPKSKELGLNYPGGFAEYALVDSRAVTKIPDSMTSLETAPLMCAGITVYSALRKCHLSPSQSVGIIGAGGGLGHLGVQFAEKMGLDVVAIEAADGPLQLVKDNADVHTLVIDARKTDAAALKQEISVWKDKKDETADEQGLDAVLVLTESQGSFDYGMKLLKRHGTLMIVAIPKEGFHLSAADICRRDIKILGVQVGSVKMLREMMQFVGEHKIRSVSRIYPFDQLNQLVEDSHNSQGGKYVLDVSSLPRT